MWYRTASIGLLSSLAAFLSGCSDSPAEAEVHRVGEIVLHQARLGDETISQLLVDFATVAATSERTTCAPFVAGACTARRCNSLAAPHDRRLASAGVVSLSGSLWPAEVSPDESAFYSFAWRADALFSPGSEITVNAHGDAVPAFTHTLRTPPANVRVRAPDLSETHVVPSADELVVVWDVSDHATVAELVVSYRSSSFLEFDAPDGLSFECAFDLATGRGEVPSAVTSAMRASHGPITFKTRTTARVEVPDGWDVSVIAREVVSWAGIAFE